MNGLNDAVGAGRDYLSRELERIATGGAWRSPGERQGPLYIGVSVRR